MIGDLIIKILKPLNEWAKAHSQQRVVGPKPPRAGDVWMDDLGKPVAILEADIGWVKFERQDGTKSTRYTPGFMKHFRPNEKLSV